MKNVWKFLITQLPSRDLHELGVLAVVITLGLFAWFTYTGDVANAERARDALFLLLLPAPFRPRERDVTEVVDPTEAPTVPATPRAKREAEGEPPTEPTL